MKTFTLTQLDRQWATFEATLPTNEEKGRPFAQRIQMSLQFAEWERTGRPTQLLITVEGISD